MLRLSIQARQALAKLSLPLFIAASLCVMLIGRADQSITSAARMAVADGLAPLYASVAEPLATARRAAADGLGIIDLVAENRKLRAENAALRRWYAVALALESENATLKENLHWLPDPSPSFVTGRVVADAGGIYARSLLVYLGPTHAVRKGQVALDAAGLVGRVAEVGARSARVLLITDGTSRIPVELPRIGAHAIMAGTGGPCPRLIYMPDGVRLTEGERVVTSSEAGAFPAGLPIGTVRLRAGHDPEVVPAAGLDDLAMVRLFDYKLAPLAATAPAPGAAAASLPAPAGARTDVAPPGARADVAPVAGPVPKTANGAE